VIFKNKFLLSLIIIIILLPLGFFSWKTWRENLPLISPLELIETLAPIPSNKKTGKIVFGFLPYWNMKLSNQLTIKPLTHLAYFGIDINGDGTIKKLDNPKEEEPGWTKLNSNAFNILERQLKITNKKTILTVRVMTYDQITSILNQSNATNTAIDSIINLVVSKNFDGINLDFEASALFDQQTRDNFTTFVRKIKNKCRSQNPQCEISVDIFADSAIKNRLYNLKDLIPETDLFVVMAYDFYRPSNSQAGPVAPIRGRCSDNNPSLNCLEYDINTSIADITKIIPPEKILLGIPFYGYQWQTVDTSFLSNSYPKTGALASYKRIQEIINDPKTTSLTTNWSNETLSPYLTFSDNGQTYQIHYENSQSLSLKIALVHQANLGGIAIWALGYETPYQDLWETISSNI
jgi:spore germination protein